MEYPGGWDELTAALNVADADEAWAFILAEELICDDAPSLKVFEAAVEWAVGQRDFTGGSFGFLVAERLKAAGVAPMRPIGPDPFGDRMEARITAWRRKR